MLCDGLKIHTTQDQQISYQNFMMAITNVLDQAIVRTIIKEWCKVKWSKIFVQ